MRATRAIARIINLISSCADDQYLIDAITKFKTAANDNAVETTMFDFRIRETTKVITPKAIKEMKTFLS